MTQRLAVVVTVINLVILALTFMQAGSATGQTVAGTLRGRVLELVDERGVVRARLSVKEPTSIIELDLFDKKGIIRVKLGTGESGSGLVLTDEGTESASRSYVQLLARRTGTAEFPKTTSITLHATDGRERVISPP